MAVPPAVRTLSVGIRKDWKAVYAVLAEPLNFNRWAEGLGNSLRLENGRYVGQGPSGPLSVRFSPRNEFGIADHWVGLGEGQEVYVPLRVVANGDGCEVMLTLFRQPAMSDAEFAADIAAVEKDLAALRQMLEDGHGIR